MISANDKWNYGKVGKKGKWECATCKTKFKPVKIGEVAIEKETFLLAFEYKAARCPNCKEIVLDDNSQRGTTNWGAV